MSAILQFIKPKNKLEEGGRSAAPVQSDAHEPEKVCPNCHKRIPLSHLWADQMVCSCGYHFRMKARQRIMSLVDKDSFMELNAGETPGNPLQFPGYGDKLAAVRDISGESEAVVCGTASVNGKKICIFAMESYFMMGSMGCVVGEKITNLFEYALKYRYPVIGYTVSGGARMQEGLLSLMQMAKTSSAVKRHSDAGLLYAVILTDPTTGGVTASFAMGADIIAAEPGATIGFAGARVIEQTTRKPLQKGFQKAEFMLKHGFVDCIVPRKRQKSFISSILFLHNVR